MHLTRPRAPALAALAMALASACTHSGPRGAAAPPSLLADARSTLHAVVETRGLPGLAVTVHAGGQVRWREGFGVADLARGTPATPGTRYRIGSLSKLLTATALLRLAEAGAIDLDAPARRYLPELTGPVGAVTLRQLAHHTGGVRHYAGREFISTRAFATTREALAIFSADSLLFPPGSRYNYSSHGYNVLGAVIEAATGREFSAALAQLVLHPAGLHDTEPDRRGVPAPRRATLYDASQPGPPVPAPDDDLSGRLPSGGYLSTTDDLAAFGAALLQPGLLTAESLEELFTAARLPDGTSTGVGLGWRVGTDSTGLRYYHHAGSSNGGRAALVILPASGVVVAMASNLFAGWNEQEALAVARRFIPLGARQAPPRAP